MTALILYYTLPLAKPYFKYYGPHVVQSFLAMKAYSTPRTRRQLGCWALQRGREEGFSVQGVGFRARETQRLQYPLSKEYTLNHIRDATII